VSEPAVGVAAEDRPRWSLIRQALVGREPPWLERFLAAVGRAAHRHGMIGEGDQVLVGVSGGKDSLSCALALALRRRRVRSRYEVAAVMVDWSDRPASAAELDPLRAFFELISVPFAVIRGERAAPDRALTCYSCARERKRLVFDHARDLGFSRVAFGHHLDDFLGTALMNICFQGRLEPMEPVRSFFDGSLTLIRPLCEVRESSIRSLAARLELPVFAAPCPNAGLNYRDRMKPIVAELAKMDKLVREKAYRAWFGEEERWTSGI